MLLELYSFLFHAGVQFPKKREQRVTGVVTEIKKTKWSLKVMIKSGDNTLCVSFPNNSCTPYLGDTVKILYKRYNILFFGEYNTVTSWSRKASNVADVHNTLPKIDRSALLSKIL